MEQVITRIQDLARRIEFRGMYAHVKPRIDVNRFFEQIQIVVSYETPDVYNLNPPSRVTSSKMFNPDLFRYRNTDQVLTDFLLTMFLDAMKHEAMESFWIDGHIFRDPHQKGTL